MSFTFNLVSLNEWFGQLCHLSNRKRYLGLSQQQVGGRSIGTEKERRVGEGSENAQ